MRLQVGGSARGRKVKAKGLTKEFMPDQKLIKLKINDRDVQVPQGTLVIEATRRLGTEVPSFCYYPGLSLHAAARRWR